MSNHWYLHGGKRVLDILVAAIALIVISPLLLGVSLLIRLKLGAPILFRQERPGLHGKPFTLLKFRTMTDARDETGALLSDTERLLPFGKFLRSTSLDEFPELVNVLRGEMSLVGPRPLLMHYLDRYTAEQMRRHDARPGITGWAQVNGRNMLSWEERFKLDIWYLDHQSFWLDMKIILLTLSKVARREGIHLEGHATMTEFLGTLQTSEAENG